MSGGFSLWITSTCLYFTWEQTSGKIECVFLLLRSIDLFYLLPYDVVSCVFVYAMEGYYYFIVAARIHHIQ